MKIAIFEPYLEYKGGAQKVISKYANYLQEKGHNVEIFTQRYNPKTAYKEFNKIKVNIIKPHKKVFSFLAFLKKFGKYDIYISNDWPSNFISIRNQPSIWICYSPKRDFYDLNKYYINQGSLKQKINIFLKALLFKKIDKLSIKRTTKIYPISKTIKERIKKFYKLNPDYIFYCGIDSNRYKSGKYENYFLCISRLVKPKRIDLAIKAMNYIKNKNIELYVVGRGPEENYLKQLAKNNKNIKFLGEVDDKRLYQLYSNCLGVIFTPIREDWGLIPLEAAASEKTTIGVNEGGLRETILDKKTGYLISNVNPKKIAEKIDNLSNNPLLAKKMGKSAKKYCGKFSWENILPKFEKKIKKIVKEYNKNKKN